MAAPRFPEPKPGDPVRAEDEAALRRYVSQLGNNFTTPTGFSDADGNQIGRLKGLPAITVAEITEIDCDKPWRHGWREVLSNPANDDQFETLGNASSRRQSGGAEKWFCISRELTEYIPIGTIVLISPFYNQENELVFVCHFVHEPFWSKLTASNDEDGEYSFTEQGPDGAGGLQDLAGGRTGVFTAQDVNGELCIPNGTIVRMVFSEKLDCEGADIDRYLFEYRPHLDSWFEISSSPGNTGPVYDATFMVHDGAGDLQLTAFTTDFLREVNGKTDINLGSDLIVFGHFLGLSDDGDEGTFTKRFAFDRGGTGSTSGNTSSFWARLDSRSASSTYNYTKLNDDLSVAAGPVTGTADEVNDNDMISIVGSPFPIVRVFTAQAGDDEHFEYQPEINIRLTANNGAGDYDFIAISAAGADIAGYVGTAIDVNLHPYLTTDADLGAGKGLRARIGLTEVGESFFFQLHSQQRQFWAELGARNCSIDDHTYGITPKKDDGAGFIDDAQNPAVDATEANGFPAADSYLGTDALILVTEQIDPGAALADQFTYHFDAGVRRTMWEITVEGVDDCGEYTAKLLDLEGADVQDCVAADITRQIFELNSVEGIPIGTKISAYNDADLVTVRFLRERSRFHFKASIQAPSTTGGTATYDITPLHDDGTTDLALVNIMTTADEINGQEFLLEIAFDTVTPTDNPDGIGPEPIVHCIMEEGKVGCADEPDVWFDMSLEEMWGEITADLTGGAYQIDVLSKNLNNIGANVTAAEVNATAGIPVGTNVKVTFQKGVYNAMDHFECSCQPVSSTSA